MSTMLKNLLGNGARGREATEDLQNVLREIHQERAHFEALTKSVHSTYERIQELGAPISRAEGDIEAVTARLASLEERVVSFEQLASRLRLLDEEGQRLGQRQEHSEVRIARTGEETERIRNVLEELSRKVEKALDLKDRMDAFLEMDGPINDLQVRTLDLRDLVDGATQQVARLNDQNLRAMDAHKIVLSKFEMFDRLHHDLLHSLEDKERRVAKMEKVLPVMDDIKERADEVRRQVNTLKALADYAAQKTSALEAQREITERAIGRADELDQAMRQIDASVRQQQENAKLLSALQEDVSALQALHEQVIERSQEIDKLHREGGDKMRQIDVDLSAARDEARSSIERLEFDSRGLASVSQRVTDLRGALAEFETRFYGLSESSRAVDELQARSEELSARLESFSSDIARLDAEAEVVKGLRRSLDDISVVVAGASERAERIEESRPSVEAALRDLEQLRGAHAMVKDALEQIKLAAADTSRVREEQSETRTWLTEVNASVGDLGERLGELRKMTPTVELVQGQAQRLNESITAIESRREFLEDMHRRMADLAAQGTTLEDRSRDLQGRMEAAEQRFVPLAAHADEAERLGKAIAAVAAVIEETERNSGAIVKNVAVLEARYESVDRLAERTRALQLEIEQRQYSLEEAAKDLQRASTLRKEAAAAVQDLEERTRRIAADLSSVDERAAGVEALSAELEHRAAGLKQAEQRIEEFQERLKTWERVEQEVARSLDHLSARQGTVEALKADIDRMFQMAEKTSTSVREATAAHKEIESNRGSLAKAVDQLREVRETITHLEERKRQLVQAESRLARSEALLIDVRSSLQVLQSQKVVVDQAVEKAGSLQFLLKQGEAMIEGLREERRMTTQLRAVASTMDDEYLEDQGEDASAV